MDERIEQVRNLTREMFREQIREQLKYKELYEKYARHERTRAWTAIASSVLSFAVAVWVLREERKDRPEG